MKKIKLLLGIICVLSLSIALFQGLSVRALGIEEGVYIPDAHFKSCLADYLGQSVEQPITAEQLHGLSGLISCDEYDIADLSGAEYLTGISDFEVAENNITDLSSIHGLTQLQSLDVSANYITSLSDIAGLTNLQTLSISRNKIADLSTLAGMTQLQTLYGYNDNIEDASILGALTNIATVELTNQKIKLDYVTMSSDGAIMLANPIVGLDSMPLAPVSISDNGEYIDNAIVWNNLDTSTINEVSFTFAQTINGLSFDGTVTVPLLKTDNIYIPDNHLSDAFTAYTGHQAPYTAAELGALGGTFAAYGRGIENIEGVEYLTGINELDLSYNDITDFSPLSNLTGLIDLNIMFNLQTKDFSPIAELKQLQSLNIENTQLHPAGLEQLTELTKLHAASNLFTWLPSLTAMQHLNYLDVWNNQLTSIDFLAGLPLSWLSLEANKLTDIRPLSSTKAQTIYLSENTIEQLIVPKTAVLVYADSNQIADVNHLVSSPSLKTLSLENNNITSVSGLIVETALETLDVSANPITDTESLAALPQLRSLTMNDCNISNLSIFADFLALESLSLRNNGLSDLSGIAHNQMLRTLDVSNNSLISLSSLQPMQLTELIANANNLTSLSGIENLTQLTILSTVENAVTDISALASLTQLSDIHLDSNNITDLTPLSNLTNMAYIDLSYNAISDVTPLQNLMQLTTLDLSNNNITDLSPLKNLNNLETFAANSEVSYQPVTTVTAGSVTISNVVYDRDGSALAPVAISNGGVYNPITNTMTWTNLDSSVTEVNYQFYTAETGVQDFSGTVYQPLD